MKQVVTLLLVFCCGSVYAQFSTGMHFGASNKNMVAGMNSQYQFHNRFTVGLNLTVHPDRANPAFFQSRFGYCLGNSESGLSVQPYTGYSYGVVSVDKNIASGHLTTGATIRYQFNNVGMLYGDVNIPAPKYVILSIGVAGRIR